MSTIVMSACWPLELPAVAKAVLISLADQANDHGVTWPSIATICRRVCYCERAVRKGIRFLEGKGLLSVRLNGRTSNVYTIHVQACRELAAAAERDALGHDVPGSEMPPRHQVPPNSGSPGTSLPLDRHEVPPNRKEPNTNTPPLPPVGGNEGPHVGDEVQASALPPLLRLSEWLGDCAESGHKPIPADDPIFEYAGVVGITSDVLALHWWEFKRKNMPSTKRQRDWRAKFRATVEGNAYRLWYFTPDGGCALTTQGVQAQRARDGANGAA